LSGKVKVEGNVQSSARAGRLFDPHGVRTNTRLDKFLADKRLQLVSVCTHTPTHVEVALAALKAKKHVIVEKPVALDPAAIVKLERAATRAGKICMPAMCMRFWPGWSWLKGRVDSGELGAVKSAVFQRLASAPAWADDFYRDAELTGGALFDLHIHDADFVHWLFGAPKSVASTGSIDHITTLYRYPRGPKHVVAEGGWDHSPGFAFRMKYVVVFERGTAEYDNARQPQLTLTREGRTQPIEILAFTGYDGEIRHVLELVGGTHKTARATLGEAALVARCLLAEKKSLATGRTVEP
jgi:predicted dehydrogenase